MSGLLRQRTAALISIVAAAALITEDTVLASTSATHAAQPTYSTDSAASGQDAADSTSYRCETRRTVEDTIAGCDEVKKKNRGILWKILLAAVVGGIAIYLLRRTSFSQDSRPAEHALLEDGPQLPESYPEGSLAIRGFAQDGWPIVVDFEPEPGTVTQLQVTIGEGRRARKETIVLDPDGSRGRQLVKVAMPNTGRARVPTPAIYFLSSLRIGALDVDRPQQDVGGAPLRIYGLGGGPRAVGSVALEQLAFIGAAAGARFSYVAKSEFSKARTQVQQLQRESGTVRIVPVFDARRSNLSVGPQNGAWPGTAVGSVGPSRGLHRLQVTGWFTTDDRSWVAALAPNLVVQ